MEPATPEMRGTGPAGRAWCTGSSRGGRSQEPSVKWRLLATAESFGWSIAFAAALEKEKRYAFS